MLVRNIKGKRLLFGWDMNASKLQVYRFTGDGDLTVPSVIVQPAAGTAKSPPKDHPLDSGWIWRDLNGNGEFDADEYETSLDSHSSTGWSVDSRGDVWIAPSISNSQGKSQIVRHLPCGGIDEKGNPIYTFKTMIDVPAPAPFDDSNHGSGITRMEYVADGDTMYLSGFTADHKNEHRDWKTSGPVICRYDHWSNERKLRWQIVVPWESAQIPYSTHFTPDAFSVAGERLFNGYLKDGEIRVYNTDDGSYLGSLLPGPEVDKTSGWIDTMYGVRARQLSNGDYLIFAEEVWHEKVLMYHLRAK